MSYFWPQNKPLTSKRHAITQDYDVSQKSLGVGINGKVLECYRKRDKGKFALKVKLCFNIFDFLCYFLLPGFKFSKTKHLSLFTCHGTITFLKKES